MKILITGAGGFLGRGMITPFVEHGHSLRLMDVVPFESPHEVVVGNVADNDCITAALQGVDGLVIAHMAPRGNDNSTYKTPDVPFTINVTATAQLLHAAAKSGVRRIVVISSTAAVQDHPGLAPDPRTLPLRAKKGYYGLTKVCQEVVAEHFARTEDLSICCLRVGYILDGDNNVDKYGRVIGERNFQDTDRRDVGDVARIWLECGLPGYDVFTVMSTQESLDRAGVRYTCERLGWQPRYDFSWLPGDSSATGSAASAS